MLLSGLFSFVVLGIFQNNCVDAVAIQAERIDADAGLPRYWTFNVVVNAAIDPEKLARVAATQCLHPRERLRK